MHPNTTTPQATTEEIYEVCWDMLCVVKGEDMRF